MIKSLTLLLSLISLPAYAATIGITSILTANTATDTGSGLIVVVTSWDGDLDADTGDGSSAALTAGEALTSISYADESSGTTAGGSVIPLIFQSTGGGAGFDVIAVGSPLTGGGGAFVPTAGSATIPTAPGGEAIYAGFYMVAPGSTGVPSGDQPINHAPIGYVGTFNDLGFTVDGGSIAFENSLGAAPGLGAITPNGASPLSRTYNFSATTTPIPEPSVSLLGLIGFGLFLRRRR